MEAQFPEQYTSEIIPIGFRTGHLKPLHTHTHTLYSYNSSLEEFNSKDTDTWYCICVVSYVILANLLMPTLSICNV